MCCHVYSQLTLHVTIKRNCVLLGEGRAKWKSDVCSHMYSQLTLHITIKRVCRFLGEGRAKW